MMRVWIGWDPREDVAFNVCRDSILRHASQPVEVHALRLDDLRGAGLYRRPTFIAEGGQLIDELSNTPMATEFSLSRFLVPHLAGYKGYALFVDCDFLFRRDIADLFAWASPEYAVRVVKHAHVPRSAVKMDGRAQTRYPRKNWSSLMLWDCGHRGAIALTPDAINSASPATLHRFLWLQDEDIGDLPGDWNYLVLNDPSAVHFTEGVPTMSGYESQPFADEFRSYVAG